MRFDTTVDFGRTLGWWPLRVLLSGHRGPGVRKVLAIWGVVTILSIALALLEAERNWSGIPLPLGSWTLGFTFYPPVTIGVLLTIWLGPAFGASTVRNLRRGRRGGRRRSVASRACTR